MNDGKGSLKVYGATWCPDAMRARRFLDDHQVPYQWLDIGEDAAAKTFVRQTNGGSIVLPTIIFPDGAILVEPTDEQLAEKVESLRHSPGEEPGMKQP
jgi:glutaredoxin